MIQCPWWVINEIFELNVFPIFAEYLINTLAPHKQLKKLILCIFDNSWLKCSHMGQRCPHFDADELTKR